MRLGAAGAFEALVEDAAGAFEALVEVLVGAAGAFEALVEALVEDVDVVSLCAFVLLLR